MSMGTPGGYSGQQQGGAAGMFGQSEEQPQPPKQQPQSYSSGPSYGAAPGPSGGQQQSGAASMFGQTPAGQGPPQQQPRQMQSVYSSPGAGGPAAAPGTAPPARWQPQQQGQQAPGQLPTMPTAQMPQSNMPSVESLGLNGGGVQSVQNLMQALNMVHAGGNNAAMTGLSSGQPQPQQQQFLGAVPQSNGNAGGAGYYGGLSPTTPQPQGGAVQSFGAPPQPPAQGGQGVSNTSGPHDQFGAESAPFQGFGQPQYGAAPQMSNTGGNGPAAMLMSDERAKTGIEPGTKPLRSLLDQIGPHEYSYKDPADGAGRYVGPMAQELERTELGRSAIIETPRGKMVDFNAIGGGPGRLPGVLLAAASDLHARLKKLEKGGRS
jgi:hypothetical protein